MDRRLFEVEEVAGYLGVTKVVVHSWVSERKIPYIEIGGLIKFDLRRIDTWIEECSVEPIIETWEDKNKLEIEKKVKKILDDTPPKKACSKCKKEKPIDEFHKNIRGKYKRSSYCKVCGNIDAVKRWKERKKVKKEAVEKKGEQPRSDDDKQICKICGKEKSLSEFYRDTRLRNGRTTQCKVCVRARQVGRDRKRKPGQPEKIRVEEKKDEKDKVPWAIGGTCRIENNKGKVIFENGKATCEEGEEWLRKKRLKEEKEE